MTKKPKNMGVEIVTKRIFLELLNNHQYFKIYRRDKLTPRVPVMVKDGLVTVLDIQDAKALIMKISADLYPNEESNVGTYGYAYKNVDILLMTETTATSVLKSLTLKRDLLIQDAVKPFAFKSDPALTFSRIPFDREIGAAMPEKWSSFLANFTNTPAVCMWIGSLFFENSDRSQYLWLYGKGGNGKSTMAKVISTLLGDFVRYDQVPASPNQFWSAGLLHKRLIVFDDCNHYGFVKTGDFKSLTGSSKVRVEVKFCNPYDTDLDCKFLFTSNELPMVSADIADQRRIILSTALNEKSFDYSPEFVPNLTAELPGFISHCMDLYAEHCSDGRPIPTDNTEAMELGNIFDEEVEAWLASNFEYTEDKNIYTTISTFREQLSFTRLNPRNVYKYLGTKNIYPKVKKCGDKTIRCLEGLRLVKQQVRFSDYVKK